MSERFDNETNNNQRNFRLSQALYQTILKNMGIVLIVCILGVPIWIYGWLKPYILKNPTYNQQDKEQALQLVVYHLADSSQVLTTPLLTDTGCKLLQENYQENFKGYIDKINTSLKLLHEQKKLNNLYKVNETTLWQSACQQNIEESNMTYALKTLTSQEKLLQLNWAERQRNANSNQVGVASLPNNWLRQTNPWYGLAGCVYLKDSNKKNPTGFIYIDNNNNQEMVKLCNHSQLIPESVKKQRNIPVTEGLTDKPVQVKAQKDEMMIPSSYKEKVNLPIHLNMMYSELSNIHSNQFDKPLIDAYQDYQKKNDNRNFWQKLTEPPMNTIKLDGADVSIGYNIQLTLNPSIQNTAQKIAQCFTINVKNNQDCDMLMSDSLKSSAGAMYENTLVRSIGIAVLDVKNQGVLALASSDTPCYQYDNGANNFTAQPSGCPILWKKDWSKQNLNNHAVYQAVHAGSIVKAVQGLALVRSSPAFKNVESAEHTYLKQVMATSSTEQVANMLLCHATTANFILSRNQKGICRGITEFQKAGLDMGWSVNCEEPSALCGSKDLLFGKAYNSEPMIQSRYFSGVLLTDTKQLLKNLNFTSQQVSNCVSASEGRMVGGCRQGGDTLNMVMNEIYGQGNAKSSVVGAADMFASLLISANGDKTRRGAHIIEDLWGVNQIKLRPKAWRGDAPAGELNNLAEQPVTISQSDAKATLNLLSGALLSGTGLGGRNGTAYHSCLQAIGDCEWTRGIIVSKTGTPGFNFSTSNVTTKMVEKRCYNATKPSAVCQSRPYKWFVMGIKDKQGKWDKAIAVLVERNWQKTGMVDDPNDAINRAAQAGMILARQIYH